MFNYILVGQVIGKKSFQSKDKTKTYNVLNVTYKSQYCDGLECGSVFVDDIKDHNIGDKIEISVSKGQIYLVKRGE